MVDDRESGSDGIRTEFEEEKVARKGRFGLCALIMVQSPATKKLGGKEKGFWLAFRGRDVR
jgi:hypothetical protein